MKNKIHVLVIDTCRSQPFFFLAMIWLLLLIMMFTSVNIVLAHSSMVRSEPQDGEVLENSPAHVTAWFSEELDSQSSAMRVFDSQNNQVDNGDGGVDLNVLDHLSMIVSLPLLSPGTYTVEWAAASAEDGDSTQGEFSFSVSGGVDPSEKSTPPKKGTPTWFICGQVSLFVYVVLMWSLFIHRKPSG